MKAWKSTLIKPSDSILDAIKVIDSSELQIGLVVEKNMHLLGTVTDGDIRRAILNGFTTDKPVRDIMTKDYSFVNENESKENIITLMKHKKIRHLPVLNADGHIVDLKMLIDMINPGYSENYVVLMAGGQGTRLRPLTEECPKPMLRVGDKPIIETIIENLKEYGLYKFLISVNYKAKIIMDYLMDGRKLGVDIKYLEEKDELGTAGALSLIPFQPKDTLIVMNADVLTKVNFQQLLDFHKQQEAFATMCVREYQFQVPYGVVKIKDQNIDSVDEKPLHKFFVNAGIYVIEPRVLDYVPKDQYFDMPNLYEKLIEDKKVTTAFPIREYWIDIGKPGDYKQANGDYCELF